MYVYACGALQSQGVRFGGEVIGSMRDHTDTENQTWVLWQSDKNFHLLIRLSHSLSFVFEKGSFSKGSTAPCYWVFPPSLWAGPSISQKSYLLSEPSCFQGTVVKLSDSVSHPSLASLLPCTLTLESPLHVSWCSKYQHAWWPNGLFLLSL